MSRATSLASGPTLRLVVTDLDAFDEIGFAHELAKSAQAKYVLDHPLPGQTISAKDLGDPQPDGPGEGTTQLFGKIE